MSNETTQRLAEALDIFVISDPEGFSYSSDEAAAAILAADPALFAPDAERQRAIEAWEAYGPAIISYQSWNYGMTRHDSRSQEEALADLADVMDGDAQREAIEPFLSAKE